MEIKKYAVILISESILVIELPLSEKNGSGKSSILKLINGDDIKFTGNFMLASGLKISYISQDTSYLKGNLSEFAYNNKIDETLFKTILRKLDFNREQFDKNMVDFSLWSEKESTNC